MILPILPWLAFALGGAATIFALLEVRQPGKYNGWSHRLAIAAAAVCGLVFAVLVWLFIVADVGYNYVFIYTHAELALRYRIAGAWAGREGSLTLWTLFGAIIMALAARRWNSSPGQRWSLVFLGAISTAFLGAAAAQDLFARTSEFFLQQRPLGNGLNPTLRSDFFLIHPPMMFMAYALTSVPAAAAMGHLVAGRAKWSEVAAPWTRLNWLLYTAAMGLGGIWAYYTLGFGGFWAWDPVEVANLLPWLGLTVYLHAQLHHIRYGRYATIGPFLAMLPLLLTIFSTISTRSGLWVSVHAFTDPTQTFNPEPAGRFLDILDVEPTLRFHVAILLVLVTTFLALWVRRLGQDHGMPRYGRIVAGALAGFAGVTAIAPVSAYSMLAEFGYQISGGRVGLGMLAITLAAVMAAALPSFRAKDEGKKMGLDLPGLAYSSVLILGSTLLILWLWHMMAANGWSTEFYEARLPWLAAPAMLAMMVFMALPWGQKPALLMAGLSGVVALIAGYLLGAGPGFIVLAIALCVVGLDRLRRAATVPASKRLQWSGWLLCGGALLNVVFWLNPPTNLIGPIAGKWPLQLIFGTVAIVAWHQSLMVLAGANKPWLRLVVFALGGYFVAPLLAAVSWYLQRGQAARARFKPARMHQAGLYALHLAVAIALLGYGSSTYLGSDDRATFAGQMDVAGIEMNLTGADLQIDSGLVEAYYVQIETPDGGLNVPLAWESQAGAYYPLPATIRTWHSDLYVAVESVCIVAGPCTDPTHWVTAYEQTLQRTPTQIYQVSLVAHTLPGLSLMWGALALFVHSMATMMIYSPTRTRLSTGSTKPIP